MARPSIKEIHELREWLVTVHHKDRLAEQEVDQQYIDDSFKIIPPNLPENVPQLATGKAYRMVSAPAEHIVSSSPTLYREPKGKAIQAAERVAKEGNRWLKLLLRQSPQPFKEHVKKIMGRGEAWIYLAHNDAYDPEDPNDMPVNFIIPDPMIVFPDPYGGEKNGIPNRIVVYTKRIAWQVKEDYPLWKWLQREPEQSWNSMIDFTLYFQNDYRYFEAAQEVLFYEDDSKGNKVPYGGDGIQENYYGLVPFVHCYSGFGEGAADGNPVSLAVSRIRKCRDLIAEYTGIKSVINNLTMKYAEPPLDYFYDAQAGTPNPEFEEKYSMAPGAFNKVPVIGNIGEPLRKGVDKLPDPELYQYMFTIERHIDEEDPLGKIGQVIGTSGRQQMDAEDSALRRYDTVVENSSHAWEAAFGQALRIIEKIPSLKPAGLNGGDIGGYHDVRIELKAEDPIANQIKATDGDRKQQLGIIDWKTNLTQYQGFTEDEADKIITNSIVDRVLLNDPIMLRVLAMDFAQEAGLRDKYEMLAQQAEGQTKLGVIPQYGAQGGEPRVGNVQTATGREMPDLTGIKPKRGRPV